MSEPEDSGRRRYKARGPDGEVIWVDHDELWRLQQGQVEVLRRQRARRRRLLYLGLVGILVVVALAFLAARLRTREAAGEATETAAAAPRREPAAAEGDAAAGGEGEAPAPGAAAAVPSPTGPAVPERVAAAVQRWAEAWARQDVAAYLASYGAEFQPPGGASRQTWEALRRRRLTAPSAIRVEIEELEISLGGDRAEARFLQIYRSPVYSDVVRKRLEFVEEQGGWRIVAERSEAP